MPGLIPLLLANWQKLSPADVLKAFSNVERSKTRHKAIRSALGSTKATFDHHFNQYGFAVLSASFCRNWSASADREGHFSFHRL